MKKTLAILVLAGASMFLAGTFIFTGSRTKAASPKSENISSEHESTGVIVNSEAVVVSDRDFNVQVLVNGRPLDEYAARGRTYVEAIENAEYELRIHNPLGVRVAVALSVDGLNSIDAQHTTAWEASKWVIEPYQTIYISGWQVSSARARHFYFTTERDSYGAKIGQTANLGVISAVFFRERQPKPVTVTPPRRPTYPREEDRAQNESKDGDEKSAGGRSADSPAAPSAAKQANRARPNPQPDDESAATGIGRSVSHDVHWVQLDLDSHAAAEVTIRYEYYQSLVRLGIYPRPYQRPDTLRRREDARGFEDRRYSPEP